MFRRKFFILDIARFFREKRDSADRAQGASDNDTNRKGAVKPANLPVARTEQRGHPTR